MKILSNKFFVIGNLILLLVAIPITLFFVKKQQEIRSKAAAASKLYIDPSTLNTSTQCSSFNVDLMLDPATNLDSIVDFYITFDPTKIQVSAITPGTAFPDVLRAASIGTGTANMSVTTGDPTKAVSTVTKVATITFIPKGTGQNIQIGFDSQTRVLAVSANNTTGPTQSPTENVLSLTTPATVTVGSGACLTPTGTVSPSTTGSPANSQQTSNPTGTITPTSAVTGTPTTTPAAGTTITPTGAAGANQLPTCTSLTASPASSGQAPFSVLFTGVGTDPDTTGLITKASFTFGDGQTQDVAQGLTQKSVNVQTNHTYQTAGTFNAQLKFTDNAGGISTACSQNITASSSSASLSPTATPTLVEKPTATPTLAQKPTIVPTGNIAQTMGTVSLVIITIIGGFLLLAL